MTLIFFSNPNCFGCTSKSIDPKVVLIRGSFVFLQMLLFFQKTLIFSCRQGKFFRGGNNLIVAYLLDWWYMNLNRRVLGYIMCLGEKNTF